MRMRPDKIKDLADQIVQMIDQHPKSSLSAPADAVKVAVASAIRSNLEEEDGIDAEAEKLLKANSTAIDQGDMDVGMLRQKFKVQIARERGFIL